MRGATKISNFEFQYLHYPPPPLVILHELSLRSGYYIQCFVPDHIYTPLMESFGYDSASPHSGIFFLVHIFS